jgi:hypothetical protein
LPAPFEKGKADRHKDQDEDEDYDEETAEERTAEEGLEGNGGSGLCEWTHP